MWKVVSLFLSEICANICTSEAPDIELFNYLEEKLIYLDRNEFSANFHLKFLLDLSKYLGFYPDDNDSHLPFFNLEEGHFTTTESNSTIISGTILSLFKNILIFEHTNLSSAYNTVPIDIDAFTLRKAYDTVTARRALRDRKSVV